MDPWEKLQGNLSRYLYIFIHVNSFETVVGKLATILPLPQCVNKPCITFISLISHVFITISVVFILCLENSCVHGRISPMDQNYQSHNVPVPYPKRHHSELRWANFCSECIVGFMRLVYSLLREPPLSQLLFPYIWFHVTGPIEPWLEENSGAVSIFPAEQTTFNTGASLHPGQGHQVIDQGPTHTKAVFTLLMWPDKQMSEAGVCNKDVIISHEKLSWMTPFTYETVHLDCTNI